MLDPIQQPTPIGHYRQILITPEHRQHITVGRQFMVDDALDHLRGSSSKKSKHHFLFIGPRGIGKSHLLSLFEDGIAYDSRLRKSYVIARFPEESHRTLSFADFLLGLCDLMRDSAPDEAEWENHYQALQTEEDDIHNTPKLVPPED